MIEEMEYWALMHSWSTLDWALISQLSFTRHACFKYAPFNTNHEQTGADSYMQDPTHRVKGLFLNIVNLLEQNIYKG